MRHFIDGFDGLLDDAEFAEECLRLRVVAAEVAVEDCFVLAAALGEDVLAE